MVKEDVQLEKIPETAFLTPQEQCVIGGTPWEKTLKQDWSAIAWYEPEGTREYSIETIINERKQRKYCEIPALLSKHLGFGDEKLFLKLVKIDEATGATVSDPKICIIREGIRGVRRKKEVDVTRRVFRIFESAKIDLQLRRPLIKREGEISFGSEQKG